MQKLLIVGHAASGHQDIDELLQTWGMARALPSQRDGKAPQSISQTLCKAHGVKPLVSFEGDMLPQIQAGTVWDGLALDLLLANVEQDVWGWSDPLAVHLLDYWARLDPALQFVLVYDDPLQLFLKPAVSAVVDENGQAQWAIDAADQAQRRWCAYHTTLLDFCHRNRARCVLLHSGQVLNGAKPHGLAEIPAPLQNLLIHAEDAVDAAAADTRRLPNNGAATADAHRLTSGDESAMLQTAADTPSLNRYLALQLLEKYPAMQQLYEELQAVAQMPCASVERPDKHALLLRAWQENSQVALQKQELQHQIRIDNSSIQQLQQENASLQEQCVQQESDKIQIAQERDLLLEQLNIVQEKLEKLHYQAQQTSAAIEQPAAQPQLPVAAVQGEIATASESPEPIGLTQQIGNTNALVEQAQHEVNRLQQENDMLLEQLHVVQEALEKAHNERHHGFAAVAQPFAGAQSQTPVQARASIAAAPQEPTGTLGRLRYQLQARLQARKLKASDKFDAQWYLQQNPDIADIPAFARNPALHYLLHGANEGRDPSPHFSTGVYLRRHPDVWKSGMNPLLHYVCHGREEGRALR